MLWIRNTSNLGQWPSDYWGRTLESIAVGTLVWVVLSTDTVNDGGAAG